MSYDAFAAARGKHAADDDNFQPDAKRARFDSAAPGGDNNQMNQDVPPSRVVHVRAVTDGAQGSDLTSAFGPYGNITYLVVMPKNRQALVEYETIAQASAAIAAGQQSRVYILGRPVYVNFSRSQQIARTRNNPSALGGGVGGVGGSVEGGAQPSKVLLLTVSNPQYPITPDVIHSVASRVGQVLKIVVFHKTGVQAMVEFESVQSAVAARAALNNQDIYPGCCTIRCEFSKSETLNIRRHDENSRDYTQPLPHPGAAPSFLAGPPGGPSSFGAGQHPGPHGGHGPHVSHAQYGGAPFMQQQQQPPPFGGQYGQQHGGAPGAHGGTSVVMVYGLDPRVNCDRLFNIFCLYGNVMKIAFLTNKAGTAKVQMGDTQQAEAIIQNLDRAVLFDAPITVTPSKHDYISANARAGTAVQMLPDGTPAIIDFSTSQLNRFLSMKSAQKNRITRPTRVLHFFNAPADCTPDILSTAIAAKGAEAPVLIKIASDPAAGKPVFGTAEFRTVQQAIDAVALANHMQVSSVSGEPSYIVKLAFSVAAAAAANRMAQ